MRGALEDRKQAVPPGGGPCGADRSAGLALFGLLGLAFTRLRRIVRTRSQRSPLNRART